MKTMLNVAAGVVLACCLQAAVASDTRNLDAGAIREQQGQLRADAEARKGRFKRMSETNRADLLARQSRVEGLLQGVSKTTDLPEQKQIELFNELEAIEGLVNNAAADRMICERHKPIGSKRPQTICRTAAQREAMRDASQERAIERNQTCFKGSTDPLAGGCG